MGRITRFSRFFLVTVTAAVFLLVSMHAWPSTSFRAPAGDSIPELNRMIVEIVAQQIGKTVDRGECWDLAALVLNDTGASWDHEYIFGRKLDPASDTLFPGDLIQFEGVKIRYKRGNATYTETMAHHTAVIYQVKEQGVFVIAHQNNGVSGRKVGLTDLELKTIIQGKFMIYRPVR